MYGLEELVLLHHENVRAQEPVAVGGIAVQRPADAVEDFRAGRRAAIGFAHDEVFVDGVALLAAKNGGGDVDGRGDDDERDQRAAA